MHTCFMSHLLVLLLVSRELVLVLALVSKALALALVLVLLQLVLTTTLDFLAWSLSLITSLLLFVVVGD